MVPESYITSGILKDYCLGLLGAEAEESVEVVCKAYPALAEELRNLREALQRYAGSDKILQRAELRSNVWAAVQKLWEEEDTG